MLGPDDLLSSVLKCPDTEEPRKSPDTSPQLRFNGLDAIPRSSDGPSEQSLAKVVWELWHCCSALSRRSLRIRPRLLLGVCYAAAYFNSQLS